MSDGTLYYADASTTVHRGDCLEVLRGLPEASVDAVVTDPPYELGFMGRDWDASGIAYSVDLWREAARVLRPGGHLLAFGGTRTAHRLTCAIEDAGLEIRDGIAWLYGSGFPKSLDVGKAIDKRRDDRADVNRVTVWLAAQRDRAGLTNREIDAAFGFSGMAGHWTAAPHLRQAQVPQWEQWQRLRDLIGFGDEMDAEVWRLNGRKGTPGEAWAEREVVDTIPDRWAGKGDVLQRATQAARVEAFITAAATDDARRWSGWGTALKPAHEPIVVARKPLAGTVATNVLAHGTGALNIDGCRVAADEDRSRPPRTPNAIYGGGKGTNLSASKSHDAGRWPSNVVLSHAPDCGEACEPGCPVAELDEPSGASRFFPVFRYQAKAPARERPRVDGVAHPTVKPLGLMRWLVRLVTPPGGVVLDPFAGSGTTVEACILEDFHCIAVESDPQYLPLIMQRLARVTREGGGE